MRKKILATLLTIFWDANSSVLYASTSQCQTPASMYAIGCACYPPEALKKLAAAVTDLEKCNIAVKAKDALINERLVHDQSATPESAWWQSPSAVIGRVVVSVGLGTALLYLLKK